MTLTIAEHLANLPARERRNFILSELQRKSRIKVIFSGVEVKELRSLVDRLNQVIDEMEQEESDDLLCESEKEKLQRTTSMLKDLNIKYFKDGKSWSGKGRRPPEFKGLSLPALQNYRV